MPTYTLVYFTTSRIPVVKHGSDIETFLKELRTKGDREDFVAGSITDNAGQLRAYKLLTKRRSKIQDKLKQLHTAGGGHAIHPQSPEKDQVVDQPTGSPPRGLHQHA